MTPAIGLAVYGAERADERALAAARRTAELLLDHDLFRRRTTGAPIHPSFVDLHYPPYWHYDVLQGLVLCAHLGLLDDPRAQDALDLVEGRRLPGGGYPSRSWASSANKDVIRWGSGANNDVLSRRADAVLRAAGRLSACRSAAASRRSASSMTSASLQKAHRTRCRRPGASGSS